MGYDTWHWRTYNALRRALGVASVFAGGVFVGEGVGLTQRAGLTAGAPPAAGGRALAAAVGVAALALGLALCRARPYRPDLGDVSWWAGRAGGGYRRDRPRQRRSWLTGDPRPID